jgi:pimeloyl-ACP methyl ester carboxylesterase
MTTHAQPSARQLTVNGLRLHYLEWGRPDARPVICVHGYTSCAQAFNALARRLGDRVRLIAMDVRGHGESEWSADAAYDYPDQAADLAGLADALVSGPFVLIGTSMGGVIAMTYAAGHADRLRGLLLNDIGPDVEPGTSRITGQVGSRPDDFATFDEAIAYRRSISPITAARPLEDQRELVLGALRQQPDGRWGWKLDPVYITGRAARVARSTPQRAALWPVLKSLTCPTLVVWGTDSDVLSEAQARRMTATLPCGELVAIPGIGHAPTLVEPEALAALDRLLAA